MSRGLHSAEVAFLLLTQRPQVQFLAFLKIGFNVGEIFRWHWLEEGEQRLENVNQNHLVLVSGKQVLQKNKKIKRVSYFRVCGYEVCTSAKRPIGLGCWVEKETECQGFHSSSDDRRSKSSESKNNDKKCQLNHSKAP